MKKKKIRIKKAGRGRPPECTFTGKKQLVLPSKKARNGKEEEVKDSDHQKKRPLRRMRIAAGGRELNSEGRLRRWNGLRF